MSRAAVPAHRARAVELNLDEPAHPGRKLTEQEFIDWCTENTFAEWVDGEVILMTPIRNEHDDVFGYLMRLLGMYVEEHDLGRVLTEPFQTRFGRMRRRRAPDIMFVATAHLHRIRRRNIEGPPDLIVEIVSPNSATRDYRDKFNEYEIVGVHEYWIVDPHHQTVQAHALGPGKKYRQLTEIDGKIHSRVLPGFYLKPEWLWQAKRPKVSALVRELSRARAK